MNKKSLICTTLISMFTNFAMAENNSIEQELEAKRLEALEPIQQRSIEPGDTILATVLYIVDTTAGPTFGRPATSGDGTSASCVISNNGGNVNYVTQNLTVDVTGLYTITVDHSSGGLSFDGYLHLYQIAFNPLDACLNLVALDDDFDPGTGTAADGSQILDVSLNAGTQYIVVHSAFADGVVGQSDVNISGIGQPLLPVELQSFSVD